MMTTLAWMGAAMVESLSEGKLVIAEAKCAGEHVAAASKVLSVSLEYLASHARIAIRPANFSPGDA
jgi:hypothetical protein